MIKKFMSFMAVLTLCFITSQASAADMAQTEAGGEVTITITNVTGATDVSFQPSSQVNINGASVRTAFAAISGHEAVKGKEAGQNYGMASDSSNVFWIAAPATFPATFTSTNSTPFQTNWNRN